MVKKQAKMFIYFLLQWFTILHHTSILSINGCLTMLFPSLKRTYVSIYLKKMIKVLLNKKIKEITSLLLFLFYRRGEY
jgi:hypothetical protein